MFSENAFDAVMHFAAVAYVGESTLEPLRYHFFLFIELLLRKGWWFFCFIIFTILPSI